MSEASKNKSGEVPVEAVLREELAHGDAVLGTIAPILGHLVVSSENSLFSDEVVAHIRGLAGSIAGQLLAEQAAASKEEARSAVFKRKDDLTAELLASRAFLTHCHALAVERSLIELLHRRSAIDIVLSPMLQALVSSDDADVSSRAMALLTAQARFAEHMKRMELPVTELPGDLFHETIQIWRMQAEPGLEEVTALAEMQFRARYDESQSRVGLLTRLVTGMGQGARAGLSISHAGVAIFLSALALLSKQSRETAVLSTNERQLGRLALGLRAGGLKPSEVEEQFLLIHPDVALPEGFELLRSDRAAAMLAETGIETG